jgi:acetylglutamate/LysW-gamma-L-alpha-aminoadipate kinase
MIIIKIGGGASINLAGIAADMAELDEPFIVVHGANAARDKLLADLGKEKRVVTSVSGYSSVFSDEEAIDALMMAYAGLRNKRLVELCQQHGVNAVGLSGLDGKMVRARRNRGIRVKEGEKLRLLHDFSGKPKEINKQLLGLLLDHGYVPVLCIPLIDEHCCAVNSENDDLVSVLVRATGAEKIVQLIEAPGFLDDKDDPDTVVPRISRTELAERESQVEGRMKRKMLALRKLFEHGAGSVIIGDGRVEHPLRDALSGKGTVFS